ncbi:MAG: Fur family transcriptional regulator [Candidatus Dormibacteria bacterium]
MASDFIRERLLAAGQRITPQRDFIAGVLESSQRPTTAQDLWAEVAARRGDIGRATVFRTLQSLQKAGLAHRITLADDRQAYLLCSSADHHHHLICHSCGAISELGESEVAPFILQVEHDHQFITDHASFDLYGTCARCGAKREVGRAS